MKEYNLFKKYDMTELLYEGKVVGVLEFQRRKGWSRVSD